MSLDKSTFPLLTCIFFFFLTDTSDIAIHIQNRNIIR